MATWATKTLAVDLLNPSLEAEKSKHKLKRLVQSPNSFFMDVKCPGLYHASVQDGTLITDTRMTLQDALL